MAHTLKLTKGARSLALGMLNIPEQFKTLEDLNVALSTADVLRMVGQPDPREKPEEFDIWVDEVAPVDLAEVQRDLLKQSCKTFPHKMPIGAHTLILLKELGLAT